MNLLRPCPFCANREAVVQEVDRDQWAVVCPHCGAIGPQHPTQHAAERRWNNELAERRQMRDPVFSP